MSINIAITGGLVYPNVRRDESIVDHISGHAVADPYRWLEGDGEEVRAFIDAQNANARPILDALPSRAAFVASLKEILAEPAPYCPTQRGGWLFAWESDDADQPRLVRARSFEALAAPETVLDPNGGDGTLAIVAFEPNYDASLLAHADAEAGSDWRTIRVLDLRTLEDTGITVPWTKWESPTWLPGGRAFTYWAYPEPTGNALTDEDAAGAMWRFDVDTREASRYWTPDDSRIMASRFADDDWCVILARRGMEEACQVLVRRHDQTQMRVLVDGKERWQPVAVRGGELICLTTQDAPKGRVVAVNLEDGTQRELVQEHASDVLLEFEPTASGYVAHLMSDARSRLYAVAPDGSLGEALPIGEEASVIGLGASKHTNDVFCATTTFVDPGQRFHGVQDGGKVRSWTRGELPRSVAVASRTRRIWVPSSDGAKVPAFVIEPNGAKDGPRPVLIWGYGGFNIPLTPGFRPIFAAWVRAGGTLVIPNLRGGGEYGQAWHAAGTKERKQQVFDDLFAVADNLVATGFTTPEQLALHGRSNGGLLAAAGLTQRPDLWAAVVPSVGVLDMLRYHLFTVGWAWSRDYGNPDEPGVAEYLLRYSPLHNVRKVHYPPTLITTGDHDDRVVPAHSFKFAAQLQHTGLGGPFLLSIDTRAGHGIGKPKHAQVGEYADQLAFIAAHTGLEVR